MGSGGIHEKFGSVSKFVAKHRNLSDVSSVADAELFFTILRGN
jgi:hypothetical protein